MPRKIQNKIGKLAQKLRSIRVKPKKEEYECDLVEFEDDEIVAHSDESIEGRRKQSEAVQPIAKDTQDEDESEREAVKPKDIQEDSGREADVAQRSEAVKPEPKTEPKPQAKIRAVDMATLIKEAVKEQLAEELKQRDNVKERRRLEKEKKQMEKEKLESDKEAKRQALKEEKSKLRLQQEKQALEQLRASLEKGISQREENLKNALCLSIRKARSSALLS